MKVQEEARGLVINHYYIVEIIREVYTWEIRRGMGQDPQDPTLL